MHAFDCMNTSCITGAVYVDVSSNASFGGVTVFTSNTAEYISILL